MAERWSGLLRCNTRSSPIVAARSKLPTIDLLRRTPFASAIQALPLLCFDVGARGGIENDLGPLAFAVDAIGFEPDKDEYERLRSEPPGPWRSRSYVPLALAGSSGARALHLTDDRQSTTLLLPDTTIGARFDKMQLFTVERSVEVNTIGLDEAAATYAPRRPDYLKIDVEGAEGEVFGSGGEKTLASLIAIKTEVSFLPVRCGQPVAAEIDTMLRDYGFELMDLERPAHWRRHGYIIHPQVMRGPVPYARGQIIQSDAIYFRSPATLPAGEQADDGEAADRLLRACWLLMAHGFFDHAEALMHRPAAARRLAADFGIDASAALHRAALLFGRAIWRAAFYRHLRLIVPFLRHAGPALLQR